MLNGFRFLYLSGSSFLLYFSWGSVLGVEEGPNYPTCNCLCVCVVLVLFLVFLFLSLDLVVRDPAGVHLSSISRLFFPPPFFDSKSVFDYLGQLVEAVLFAMSQSDP